MAYPAFLHIFPKFPIKITLIKNIGLLLFFISLIGYVHSQRVIIPFNDSWQFLPRNSMDGVGKEEWQNITIPHTWNGDAYQHKDYVRDQFWYRKTFTIPGKLKGRQFFIRFEAVNSYAEVYLNDTLIGSHSGGYSAFNIRLPAQLLKPGDNLLTIKADNRNLDIPPLSGDFTIFGGIYRDVWLIAVEDRHFNLDDYGSPGVFISTPQVSERSALVNIRGNISDYGAENSKLRIIAEILFNGKSIVAKEIDITAATPLTSFEINNIVIGDPHLWSPASPDLYSVVLKLTARGRVIDQLSLSLGLRWFSANTQDGFMLNGQPLKLMGANRHQDRYPYGIAVPGTVHREDMALFRTMGANFVRLAHYQQADEVLRACDSLGLIVWEEIPVVDIISLTPLFKRNCKSQLKEMIRQHYNHPSVIFWGYMNEVIIQVPYRIPQDERPGFYQQTVELAKELEAVLKKEDPHRISVMACHGTTLNDDIGLTGITDVIGWNLYQGWYGDNMSGFGRFVDDQNKKYPDRPLIISEFGAGSDRRLHSLHPETFDFSIEYQQLYLEHYLPEIIKRPYIIGAAEWNFIDFNVASRQESMPRTNNKGLVYNDRIPKDVYYYFKAFLRKDTPVLHIATDDWKRRTAVSDRIEAYVPVKLYTNLPVVSLEANGISYGEKHVENHHVIFEIPLRQGQNQLTATGRYEGRPVTDHMAVHLDIIPETLTGVAPDRIDIAVNAGSNCDFIDEQKQVTWIADRPYKAGSWGYVGGAVFRKTPDRIGTTAEVAGTNNTPLFQTKREDVAEYRFDLPAGHYEIELGFADLYNAPPAQAYDLANDRNASAGHNSFDITINGKTVLKSFSPYVSAGNNTAVIRTFEVDHFSGSLTIGFEKVNGRCFVNAVRVRGRL